MSENRMQIAQSIYEDLNKPEQAPAPGIQSAEAADDKLIQEIREGKELVKKVLSFVRPFLSIFGPKLKPKLDRWLQIIDEIFPDLNDFSSAAGGKAIGQRSPIQEGNTGKTA